VLTKAFGIRFFIKVVGKATKFDLITLLLSVGSGVGLLSFATLFADCFIFNLSRKRRKYREAAQLRKKVSRV
jgi:hypothetical protein